MDKVNEQFLRVKRWYEKLKNTSGDRDSIDYEDILYAFFQNCFHLKDWIVNSNALDGKIVNKFIKSNTDMKICRDLCNGSKHLIILNPSVSSNTHVNKRKYSVTIGGVPKTEIYYWINTSNSLPVDAFDLATNCVVQWECFFKKHNLIPQN